MIRITVAKVGFAVTGTLANGQNPMEYGGVFDM